jgi:hypothetical protein
MVHSRISLRSSGYSPVAKLEQAKQRMLTIWKRLQVLLEALN